MQVGKGNVCVQARSAFSGTCECVPRECMAAGMGTATDSKDATQILNMFLSSS